MEEKISRQIKEKRSEIVVDTEFSDWVFNEEETKEFLLLLNKPPQKLKLKKLKDIDPLKDEIHGKLKLRRE